MQACERDEPQRACLEAGRHICGTRLAFTLPINRETHCPGCESVSNAEQYCKAHASNVTLEEVQAIFADADTSQAPKSGAVPLTNESDKSREARTLRPVSAFIRAGHAATMRRHGFAGDCVCEACILGEEAATPWLTNDAILVEACREILHPDGADDRRMYRLAASQARDFYERRLVATRTDIAAVIAEVQRLKDARERALLEPSDAEVAEAWHVSSPPDARVYSEGARDRMRAALSAFLSARKGKTP